MLPAMGRLTAMFRAAILAIALAAAPVAAGAAEGFRLGAPRALVETGLLKYVLPRFSLKTGVRIALVGEAEAAELVLSAVGDGSPVFAGQGQTWRLRMGTPEHAGAARFADWLSSDIGRRTIASFEVGGVAPFSPAGRAETGAAPAGPNGDAKRGRTLAEMHCRRCHAVSEGGAMNSIGSTPSFFALRALGDWDARFQSFYAANPHPAFTQVAGVTAPFAIDRPPPIVPVEIMTGDLDDILAYVASLAPADLGGPLAHQ